MTIGFVGSRLCHEIRSQAYEFVSEFRFYSFGNEFGFTGLRGYHKEWVMALWAHESLCKFQVRHPLHKIHTHRGILLRTLAIAKREKLSKGNHDR